MKKIVFLLLILFCLQLAAQNVNGELEVLSDRKILKVWGTHSERGYAQGYLLGTYLQDVMKNYILSYVYGNNVSSYNYIRTYFNSNFVVDEKYVTEAEAIITGMNDAEIDIYSTVLGRELDAIDILMASSITDISALSMFAHLNLGCSSMSSWGSATENNTELAGELVITRQMDWTTHPKLLENHLLLIHIPAEENEVPWVSFTFPGFLGALSGINENGLAAFKNVGNNNSHPNPNGVHPVLLSVRNAIENSDYNLDSNITVDDVIAAVQDKNRLAGSLIHVVTPDSAVIIECNNANGVAVRTIEENNVNPLIAGNNLVVTNHFRSLYNPSYCYRYQHFSDSLAVNAEISPERSRQITNGAGGLSHNLHHIQYIPSYEQVSWAVATSGTPAYQNESTIYELQELFSQTVVEQNQIENHFSVSLFPNPMRETTTIQFFAKEIGETSFSIFNVKGQKVYSRNTNHTAKGEQQLIWNGKDANGTTVSPGIYLYKIQSGNLKQYGKILKLH